MSNIRQEIRSLLDSAEKRLRELIAKAASAGDYDGIDITRSVAGQLQNIANEIDVVAAPAHDRSNGSANTQTSLSNVGPTARTKALSDYPKFFVEHDVLCKVGWSKKEKEEYVHKIPKEAFGQTLRAIGDLTRSTTRLFTSEQVGQRLESLGHSVPLYQVYLTLALLREKALVEKKGREGYSARGDVAAQGMKLWDQL